MKSQLTDADISSMSLLLRLLKPLISQDSFDQLECKLNETNYYAKKSVLKRDDTLLNICFRSINYAFQSCEPTQVKQIIKICKEFEGLLRSEKDILDVLEGKLDEITNEHDVTQKELLKADFYAKEGDIDKAILVLKDYLAVNRLTKKDKFYIREKLDSYFNDNNDSTSAFENIQSLMKLDKSDKTVLMLLLESSFINLAEFRNIVISIMERNKDKLDFWKALVHNLFDVYVIVYIHSNLGRPIIPDNFVFSNILEAYVNTNNRQTAIELIKQAYGDGVFTAEFDDTLAQIYISQQDYKNAKSVVQRILAKDNKNSLALIWLGEIYFQQKMYSKAIRAYKDIEGEKAKSEYVITHLVQSLAANGNIGKARKIFDEKYNLGISRNSFRILYKWVSSGSVSIDFLSDCLNNKQVVSRRKDEAWRDFDYFVRQIFEDSKNIPNNGELRVGLLRLHFVISSLKKKLQLASSNDAYVYHYSTTASIIPLTSFRLERASRFQLSNVSFMNDPAEGAILTKILESFCESDQIRSLMGTLYGNENYVYRKTYLSSFSLRRDFLPMWVQYANKGSGCCYKITSKQFGWSDSSLEDQVIQTRKFKKDSIFNRPVLYKVYYYDSETDDEILTLCRGIAESLLLVGKFLANKRILAIIAGMIDEIRYLFKSKDYKTEEEVRIVMTDHNQEAQLREPISNEYPPKMYLEMPVDLYFEELMFGPRVHNIKEWAAYLGNCSNVKQVSSSEIQFQ